MEANESQNVTSPTPQETKVSDENLERECVQAEQNEKEKRFNTLVYEVLPWIAAIGIVVVFIVTSNVQMLRKDNPVIYGMVGCAFFLKTLFTLLSIYLIKKCEKRKMKRKKAKNIKEVCMTFIDSIRQWGRRLFQPTAVMLFLVMGSLAYIMVALKTQEKMLQEHVRSQRSAVVPSRQRELMQLHEEIDSINSSINLILQNVYTINSNVSSIQTDVGSIDSELTTKNSGSSQYENVYGYNGYSNATKKKEETRVSAIGLVKTNVETLQSEIKSIKSHINEIHKAVYPRDSYGRYRYETSDRIEIIARGISSLEQKIQALESTIDSIRFDVNAIQNRLEGRRNILEF